MRASHAYLFPMLIVALISLSHVASFRYLASSYSAKAASPRPGTTACPSLNSVDTTSPSASSPPQPQRPTSYAESAAPTPLTPVLRETFDRTGFFCPFRTFGVQALAPASSPSKPLLLYLPGLDGSGLTAFVQYPSLAEAFEVRCMTMPTTDRSSFLDLIHLVRTEIRSFPGRRVFVMGESFGGLLALGTVLERTKRPDVRDTADIQGVVLVNPATSFSRTIWGKVGPLITKLPQPFYSLSLLPIGLLLVDGGQIKGLIKDAFVRLQEAAPTPSGRAPSPPASPPDQRARMAALGLSPFQIEFFSAALPVLIERLNLLPAPCLEWRLLQWLGLGSEMVEPQLHRLKTPVLVVAGTVDRLLPSFEEAKRLKKEVADCQVHYVRGAGHGGSLDQRVQLLEILRQWNPAEKFLRRRAGV